MDDELATRRDRGRPDALARLAHDLHCRRSLRPARPAIPRKSTREGALLDPDAALAQRRDPRWDVPLPRDQARREGRGQLSITCPIPASPAACALTTSSSARKLSGSQRYAGIIFPDDAIRQVFLGTLVLGDESRALQYGQDETRDIAGYVERIGPTRWRLVMPTPHFESQLDVMELVPLTGAR